MSDWEFFVQSLRVGLKAAGIFGGICLVVGLFWCALKGK